MENRKSYTPDAVEQEYMDWCGHFIISRGSRPTMLEIWRASKLYYEVSKTLDALASHGTTPDDLVGLPDDYMSELRRRFKPNT